MSDVVRIRSAEPILFGVLKITWDDAFEAVVDLRPVLAEGPVLEFLRRDPGRFSGVVISPFGNSLGWTDGDGDLIDFGTVSLRQRATEQAELLRRAG